MIINKIIYEFFFQKKIIQKKRNYQNIIDKFYVLLNKRNLKLKKKKKILKSKVDFILNKLYFLHEIMRNNFYLLMNCIRIITESLKI